MKTKLYFGDCVEVMRKYVADASVQLTVTSPPYDNLRTYNGYKFDFEATAQELWRVTKLGGVVVWVVGDQTKNGSESGTSFRQALYFKEVGFNLHDTMIWEKAGTGACGSNYAYWHSFEYMFVLTNGRPVFNAIEDIPNGSAGKLKSNSERRKVTGEHKQEIRKLGKEFSRRTNVWRTPIGVDSRRYPELQIHPAIFPEQLANDHILSWSNPGDLVLDPFVGSGTTGKMAKLLGREFIGIDCSAEYIALARERIKKV